MATAEFARGLRAVVADAAHNPDALNARTEDYLLQQEHACGAIRVISTRGPCNPTKQLLRQQPWFNASCHVTRKAWHTARHQLGTKHSTTRATYSEYTRVCKRVYSQFTSTLPVLHKHNPKAYYDTIYPSRGQHTQAGCSVDSYEQHCQRVFHLPTEPV